MRAAEGLYEGDRRPRQEGRLKPTNQRCCEFVKHVKEELLGKLEFLKRQLKDHEPSFYRLSFTNFCKYLKMSSDILKKLRCKLSSKHSAELRKAVAWIYGQFPTGPELDACVQNFSSRVFSLTEREALSRGLGFCVPPRKNYVDQSLIDTEFENFFRQLSKTFSPNDPTVLTQLKAKLVDTSKSFLKEHVPLRMNLPPSHLKALEALKKDQSIVISRPDKGSGVVVLDRMAYTDKMSEILGDSSRFAPATSFRPLKAKVNNVIQKLKKSLSISSVKAHKIAPEGEGVPKLYGLPKVHKLNVPLRPILSMIGSQSG